MGRFVKEILDNSGINKRESGYYSTPRFIADFLTKTMIGLNPNGKFVLDPAVGKEELLEGFFIENKVIDSFDIIDFGLHKFSDNYYNQNFIEYYKQLKQNLIFGQKIVSKYDYIIANPPYNCHEIDYIKNNKKQLEKLFPKVGVLNMYSMFLDAMIDISNEGTLIGVIISDSFLTARLHSGLRQRILEECSIHNLILCPNDLFREQNADVRTVILILQKGKKYQNKVKIKNRLISTSELQDVLEKGDFQEVSIDRLILSKEEPYNQFVVGVPEEIINLFNFVRIKDKFKCITGISTGNDGKYLSKQEKYGYSIPFYKNPGKRKFFTEPDAFIIDNFLEESAKVKDFMVRNKNFLFKEGITCSSMGLSFSACYLPENSAYGVNANIFLPKNDLYWMLSYLNSYLVTYLVRGVLIRSNMVTSGYVSQIPVPEFPINIKEELGCIAKELVLNKNKTSLHKELEEINRIIYDCLLISNEVKNEINNFCENLQTSV